MYIRLFTCTVSKAGHLEIVADLIAKTFLQGFKRFISHRSLPRLLISDNISIYMAAAEEITELFHSTLQIHTLNRKTVT